MKLIKKKLSSRKLWAAIVGFGVSVSIALFCPDMEEESVQLIMSGCVALAAYILGEGIADAGNSAATDKKE
jgi:hypothetical protein